MHNSGSLYNAISYPGVVSPNTRPDHLSLCSLWHEGPRPPLNAFRLIEIGCGDAANLLPIAFYNPESVFIGIDNAEAELDRARKGAQYLELKNIRFVPADIREFGPTGFAPCDYIIVHGLFSWAPQEVRDAILHFCRQTLTQSGLAYISYNAQPGWAIRRLVRKILMREPSVAEAAVEHKAQRAMEYAARLLDDLPSREFAYVTLLSDELERVGKSKHGYVFHEYLTQVNEGFWLGDFVKCARRHGLDYLADAQFCRWEGYIPEEIGRALDRRKLDRIQREEAADLLGNRYFRASILCRADAWRADMDQSRLMNEVYIATSLRAKSDPFELADGIAERFYSHSPAEVTLEAAITKAAVLVLASQWPFGMRLEQLHRKAMELIEKKGYEPSTDSCSLLKDDLITLFESGQIDFRLKDSGHIRKLNENPKIHALARYEVECRDALTTRYHMPLPLDSRMSSLAQGLDGSMSLEALGLLSGKDFVNEALELFSRWGLLEL